MPYNLEEYSLRELRAMGERMDLAPRRSKQEMINDITIAFDEYEEYKRNKLDRYERKRQLGHRGKEGITYLVVDTKNREYAMKTFRKGKASSTLKREYALQRIASKKGVAPRVFDYDTVSKYIVMEKMDGHLHDEIARHKGVLYKYQQMRIIEIFSLLDSAKVFHNDANICNYMLKDKQIYLIDYGFAKEITPKVAKSLGTEHPNMTLMLLGLVLKLKEMNLAETSYKYLKACLSAETVMRFRL